MALVDATPGGAGRFVRVTEALAELTGSSRAALVGMGESAVTHRDDLDEDAQQMSELIEGKIDRISGRSATSTPAAMSCG